MLKTQSIVIEISFKALGHQYVSENVIKIGSDFGAIFWKKPWAIVQCIFQKLVNFFKWP